MIKNTRVKYVVIIMIALIVMLTGITFYSNRGGVYYKTIQDNEYSVSVDGTYIFIPKYDVHIDTFRPYFENECGYTLKIVKSSNDLYLNNNDTVKVIKEYDVNGGDLCKIDMLLTPQMGLLIIPDNNGKILIKNNDQQPIDNILNMKVAEFDTFTNCVKNIMDDNSNGAVGELVLKKNSKSVVYVSQTDENADYCSVMDAVACADENKHTTINIDTGVYEEFLNIRDRYKSLTFNGCDKENCIIISRNGLSRYAPFTIGGNFKIKNLTIKMTVDGAPYKPTYSTDSELQWETNSGYCIHCDNESYDENKKAFGLIDNCDFYSESNSAIGLGVNNNQTIIIKNCHIVRNTTDQNYLTPWDELQGTNHGAFLGHVSPGKNKNLILINNIIRNDGLGNVSSFILGDIQADGFFSEQFRTLAIHNTFYCNETGDSSLHYEKGVSKLSVLSCFNNDSSINYFNK